MPDVLIYIVTIIVFIVFSLMGAFDIAEAVKDFKKQRYFCFGIDVFAALIVAFIIAEAVFES